MEKILKKYTTIPQHLYVERYADIQLKRIIEEMQRPGYVLVARQMGKTNLLFNAKRTLENDNRLFAYVDLSNLYNNERDCYRNIINSIIEPNLGIFEVIESDIEKIREKDLPPHNEYSRSLLKVLNHFKGDLVIILDEIDALKSVGYSDNIFAQIRSNYFSRTNYPVFERLTYVLSGVIEPTELIRDKNKSPFNIGDKIYLDDFTKEEHNNFIEKSKLVLPDSISDEVFNWTNGNPRLTFDICAEIENYIINNGEINSEILNKIITKKYLTTFDVAPIDHIRELVKSNKEIRKAILNIHKRNTVEISDDTKKKLYLYGIINSKFNEETQIKNKIIELSLSEDWIKSIEKEYSYIFGLARFSEKEFEDAIEIFNEILITSKKETEIEGSNYFIGLSYLKIRDYKNAVKHFSYDYKDIQYKNDALAFLGVCQIGLGDENGISTLEKAIEVESNSHAYHNALLNLAVNINDTNKSLDLFEKLHNSTLISNSSDKEELNQLRALSLYYQADILEKDNLSKALNKIESAIECSSNSDSLFLLFYQYHLQKEKDENIKDEIVNRIINNNLKFEKNNPHPINFTEAHIYYYLDFVFNIDNLVLFEKLLDYVDNTFFPDKNRCDIVYQITFVSQINQAEILNYLKNSKEIEINLLLDVVRDLILINGVNQSMFDEYLLLFKGVNNIASTDIYIFALNIKHCSDKGEIDKGIELCDIINEKLESNEDKDLRFESVIIYYWYSNLFLSHKDNLNAVKYADIALDIIKESNGKKMSMIDEEGLKSISEQLNRIKRTSSIVVRTPVVHTTNKIGRNERVKVRYLDGQEKEDKHKKFELDISAGKCVIIS